MVMSSAWCVSLTFLSAVRGIPVRRIIIWLLGTNGDDEAYKNPEIGKPFKSGDA